MGKTKINFNKTIDIKEITDVLYFGVFTIYISYYFLLTTMWKVNLSPDTLLLLRIISFSVVMLRLMVSERYRNEEIFFCVLLSILLLYAWESNQCVEIGQLFFLIIGSKGIQADKMIKIYLLITSILLLVTIGAALTGHIQNLVYHQVGRRTRFALGVGYPTDFAAHVFFGALCYVFIRREKLRYADAFFVALLGLFVYVVNEARMNAICLILLSFGILVYVWIKCEPPYWMGVILALAPVLCAGSILSMTLVYSPEKWYMEKLNGLLNNRLLMGKMGIDQYGISWWGKTISMEGNGGTTQIKDYYFFLDSSYVNILLRFGLVVLLIVLTIMVILSFRALQKREWVYLWVFTLIAVQCVVEHHLLEVAYNPFLWLIFADWRLDGRNNGKG